MGRVYFCTEREFPRGDAGANRILHMAKALQIEGWDTVVCSMGHSKKEHWSEENQQYIYQTVKYYTIPEFGFGKFGRVFRRFVAGKYCCGFLKKAKLETGDVVIVYSSNYSFCKTLYKFVEQKKGTKLLYDVVEWHQPFQFDRWSTRYIYKSFEKSFKNLFPATGEVIVISECLKDHFSKLGCRVLKLPIYITPDNTFSNGSKSNDIINLIYPGNPYNKDSLETMLKSIEALSEKNKAKVRFHLTGVKKSVLEMCVPNNVDLLISLIDAGIVLVHEWLEYDELMKLYDEIDFAFIARPNNIVTQANFPSKVPELMNRGIPVIITSTGDIADYITDGVDAILMSDCTVDDGSRALNRCLEMDHDEIVQMHNNAKQTARTKFDYRLSAKSFSDFLKYN